MDPFQLVLNQFGPALSGLRWERVGGGFSGAEVWRGEDANGPRCALKAWPPGHPGSRLEETHRWMAAAGRFPFVPSVIPASDGAGVVAVSSRVWDATRWMPGSPRERPTAADVKSALAAIAQLHTAWGGESVLMPSPGVRNRLRLMRDWLASPPQPGRYLHSQTGLMDLWRRAVSSIDRGVPSALAALEPAEHIRVRCQPCVRDLRGEHVLFSGGAISGIVDFGAMAIDEPAVDLARLLGDYAETDEGLFAFGLRAYREAGGKLDMSVEFLTQLARTGAMGSAINWLRRLAGEGELPVGIAAVEARLARILRRIEAFAPG